MNQFENVVEDRGSRYAVSGDVALNRNQAKSFIKKLTQKKKYAKATHNTWAIILKDGERIKNDDGEGGAGLILLQTLEHAQLYDHIIVVTRWYGGVHLGADRFRHVRRCAKLYIENLATQIA